MTIHKILPPTKFNDWYCIAEIVLGRSEGPGQCLYIQTWDECVGQLPKDNRQGWPSSPYSYSEHTPYEDQELVQGSGISEL